MDTLTLKTLVALDILLIIYSNASQFDEGCFIEEPPLLQLAFVVDRTYTFFSGGQNSFFNQFSSLAPTLMDEIEKDYPGAQFALTVHADWNKAAGPDGGVHTEKEGCYSLFAEFTSDKKFFQSKIKEVSRLPNGQRENGLSALAFTAADAKLGWIRKPTTQDGKKLRRVMILVTDEDDLLKLKYPGNRTEFRGDGTDTCSTSKPPNHKILGDVFRKYEMTVIALLYINGNQPKLDEKYRDHFKAIGNSIPYCGKRFSARSRAKGLHLFDSNHNFEVPKGFWSDEDKKDENEVELLSRGTDSSKEDLAEREKNIAKLSGQARAGKFEYFIQFVKECLGQTRGCIYGDPPSFNTLGF